jgi:aspartate/methionine/tyrosine aminotransferase
VAKKLTVWERRGLPCLHNLADGHANQHQNERQLQIVARLPDLYLSSSVNHQFQLEHEFSYSFFTLAQQKGYSLFEPPLYHYSSSVSIEIIGNFLRQQLLRVGVLQPTFDNIPAILKRVGVRVSQVDERCLTEPEEVLSSLDVDALFLVVPNNPTGAQISKDAFIRLAQTCAERRLVLILDLSFRFFGELHQWDQYELLHGLGTDFITIEDTGKTWPTLDLKTGFVVASPGIHRCLTDITDDVLLNVSPFCLRILKEYILQERSVVENSARSVATENREILRSYLSRTSLDTVDRHSTISVEWIGLPAGWHSVRVCEWLYQRSITILPGTQFFWAQEELGLPYVRVALMRPPSSFEAAAKALCEAVSCYRPADE